MTLSLRQKIGQLFIVGFHGKTIEDPWVKDIGSQIQKGEMGGVILFSYNIQDPVQLRSLIHFFKECTPLLTPFISVDQEGGVVQRLTSTKGFSDFPSPSQVTNLPLEEARAVYRSMAKELTSVGINLDFAPCIDLNPMQGPLCPVIGAKDRSYGIDPEIVALYGRLINDVFSSERLLSVLKHFPGHGSAQGDSHEGFVDVTSVWQERELEPFLQLAREGKGDMIMTAHIFNERLDPVFPATLSRETLSLLRNVGYDGVIISDDLHMGAIQSHYNLTDACLGALNAGCDMIILSNNKAAAIGVDNFSPSEKDFSLLLTTLEKAILDGAVSLDRIEEAYQRVWRLKQKLQ